MGVYASFIGREPFYFQSRKWNHFHFLIRCSYLTQILVLSKDCYLLRGQQSPLQDELWGGESWIGQSSSVIRASPLPPASPLSKSISTVVCGPPSLTQPSTQHLLGIESYLGRQRPSRFELDALIDRWGNWGIEPSNTYTAIQGSRISLNSSMSDCL